MAPTSDAGRVSGVGYGGPLTEPWAAAPTGWETAAFAACLDPPPADGPDGALPESRSTVPDRRKALGSQPVVRRQLRDRGAGSGCDRRERAARLDHIGAATEGGGSGRRAGADTVITVVVPVIGHAAR
jgi:hypothetical protein